MFKRVVTGVEILAALAIVVFVVMLFANDSGDDGGGASGPPGAGIYSANCATCHGADGQGGVGPQLAGRVTQRFPDVAKQIALVTNGSGGMPSFRNKLSAAEIRQVVEYTRTGLTG